MSLFASIYNLVYRFNFINMPLANASDDKDVKKKKNKFISR